MNRLAVILVALAGIGAALPLSTAHAQSGLTVTGAKVVAEAMPGAMFVHQMNISLSKGEESADIDLRATSLAQGPDGTPFPGVEAGTDSASDFVHLDRTSFRLEPGRSETVNATFRLPASPGAGGRYALIRITARPSAGNSSIITGVDVPVYITIRDTALIHEGQVSGLDFTSTEAGIQASTSLLNTGNHDFKVGATFRLFDVSGNTLAQGTASSLWPLIPGMTRALSAYLIPAAAIPAGEYSLECDVALESGPVIARAVRTVAVQGVAAVAPPSPPATAAAPEDRGPAPSAYSKASLVIPAKKSLDPFIIVVMGALVLTLIASYLIVFGITSCRRIGRR
jgi:hypothetical protein